jgi:glycosidase
MRIYYNSLDIACKSIVGAIAAGDVLQLNLFLLKEGEGGNERTNEPFEYGQTRLSPENCAPATSDCYFLVHKDGGETQTFLMNRTSYGWHISLKVNEIGLYYYSFSIGEQFLVKGNRQKGILRQENSSNFLLTVYAPNFQTPEWFKGGILYQIFPDRFCRSGTTSDIIPMSDIVKGRIYRSEWGGLPQYKPDEQGKVRNNDFFGGNFRGMKSKLPYLKSLNVSAIYLNPIFEAASNHRYDTSDYMKVDPYLGSKDEFQDFVDESKKYGIQIILDGVFNHTGDNSVYFNKYGTYPSLGAYQSKDSPYYSWYTFQEFPEKYSSWWGIDILPEVNEASEDYQNFIFGENGVLKTWLACGIGGYRLDVADELPDFFLKKLRKAVKESNSEAMIIGEVWENAADKIAYSKRREYLQGYELDSVMNYPLKNAVIEFCLTENAAVLSETICTLRDNYPKQVLDCLMNILGTHDTARILTVLGEKACYNKDEMADPNMRLNDYERQKAIKKLKMAALLQYTLPGVPCVYYGDEIGMEGYGDPFCRQCFDWDNPNKELLAYYKRLGELRNDFSDIFKDGELEELFAKNGCYFFKRYKNQKTVYLYVNNCAESLVVKLPVGQYREYLSEKNIDGALEIQPFSCGIFSPVL